jgi:hypothetical protein
MIDLDIPFTLSSITSQATNQLRKIDVLTNFLCGDPEPFLCNTADKGHEKDGSFFCAWLVTMYSGVLIAVALFISKEAKRKIKKMQNEVTNLFGISVFSLKLLKLIVVDMVLTICVMILHPLMMHVNILMTRTEQDERTRGHEVVLGVMQGFLVLIYQLKRILSGWVDLNILFELIALLHLVWTEEKMSLNQILFSKKSMLHVKRKQIEFQENIISIAFRVLQVFVVIVQLYGLIPRWVIFRMYTRLQIGNGIDDFENWCLIFIIALLVQNLIILLTLLVVLIIFFYKTYKLNRNELRLHGPTIALYSLCLYLEKGFEYDLYIYMFQLFNQGTVLTGNDHWKIPHSAICWMILHPMRMLVPLTIVLFKRSEDIFMSFSKIDHISQVSMF